MLFSAYGENHLMNMTLAGKEPKGKFATRASAISDQYLASFTEKIRDGSGASNASH